jgi:hypothetical protein
MFKLNSDKLPRINPANLNDAQLQNTIDNYRRWNMTHVLLFADMPAEQEMRRGKELTFATSLALVQQASKDRRFICCKDLADGSGADWSKVHYQIGGHLFRLDEYSYLRHGIMISAIVVPKEHIATGKMTPSMIKGFAYAVEHLLPKDEINCFHRDPEAFYREQQPKVFDWAAAA